MSKNPIITVTKDDCEWRYARGSGKGGQKRNKTSTKVQCFHPPSGARGESDDTRSQHQNKRIAFLMMVNSREFQSWVRIETMKRIGTFQQIEEEVARQMHPSNLRIEVRCHDGKWHEIDQ